MANNFPLAWPPGWQRTQLPHTSRFASSSISVESNDVLRELRLMGATNIVISSNMRYTASGAPLARQGYIEDKGVAVYFDLNGQQDCIPCDKWNTLEDNLHAVAKTVNALRGIERWGAKEMVNAAFKGFNALPASVATPLPHREWWVVLDVLPQANAQEVRAAYRSALKLYHPDSGGTEAELDEVRRAYKEWENS